MKSFFTKVPFPIIGAALGLSALGNLLQPYSSIVRIILGILSGIFLLLFILKIIASPKAFKEDMNNPISASIFATFPMTLMILSVYLKPLFGILSEYTWFFALGIHIGLIIYFTIKFILKFDIKKVFASYFIVYVGIVVASTTAPAYGAENIGTVAFWFGLITLLLLLPIVAYRYLKFPNVPDPIKPIFCIFTAPSSLALAGYLQSVSPKSTPLVIFLAISSTILYLIVLVRLPKLLKLKFYPSFSSFTFPFVISGIAIKGTSSYLTNIGINIPFLNYIVLAEIIIATLLVAYTAIRYIICILNNLKEVTNTENKTTKELKKNN